MNLFKQCKCKGVPHVAGCIVGQRLSLRLHGLCGNVSRDKLSHCALEINHKGKCGNA